MTKNRPNELTGQISARRADRPVDPRFARSGRIFAMQRLCNGILSGTGLVALANEALPPGDWEYIGLGNEITAIDADGWARVPYGDHVHSEGVQRFTRTEADEMVGYFRNVWNRIKRAISGLPIFRGHPDHPAFANTHKDKTTYGTVADMQARDDGLYIKPVLTPEGVGLVNSGLKCFSPHWRARQSQDANGKSIYLPVFLVSIGLTDRPNIADCSLVNTKPNPKMNKALIIQILAAIGCKALANEATDEQVNAELTSALPLAQNLAKRPESTALANEQTKVTELTTKLANAEDSAKEKETALANEKTAHAATIKARNEALVDSAVKGGRITEAQKPLWIGRLERDFANEATALANEQGALKTKAKSADVTDNTTSADARAQFKALVNERMGKTGEAYTTAWSNTKRTKEGKALLAKMDSVTA